MDGRVQPHRPDDQHVTFCGSLGEVAAGNSCMTVHHGVNSHCLLAAGQIVLIWKVIHHRFGGMRHDDIKLNGRPLQDLD